MVSVKILEKLTAFSFYPNQALIWKIAKDVSSNHGSIGCHFLGHFLQTWSMPFSNKLALCLECCLYSSLVHSHISLFIKMPMAPKQWDHYFWISLQVGFYLEVSLIVIAQNIHYKYWSCFHTRGKALDKEF